MDKVVTLAEIVNELERIGFQKNEIQQLVVKGSCEVRNYPDEESDTITVCQTIREYSLYKREEFEGDISVDIWTLSHRNTGRTKGSFWGEEIIDHQW